MDNDDKDCVTNPERRKRNHRNSETSDSEHENHKDDKSKSSRKKREPDEKRDRYEFDQVKSSKSYRRSYDRGSFHRYRENSRDRAYRKLNKYRDLDNPSKKQYTRYWGNNKEEYSSEQSRNRNEYVGSRYYEDKKALDADYRNKKDDRSNTNEDSKPETPVARQKKTVDLLTSKTGGAYIPPAKLRLMQAEITDKSSTAYQRISWEALKKSIHGFINKVNTGNIGTITKELLQENIVRGRGLLCKSIIQAQAASPTFTHVYAALVAIINSKFPNIGELLLRRLVIQFKRSFKRNDKNICISSATFIAHLVNQRVAHEILALEILTLLVESPTDDSVEVAIAFLKECGQKLTEVSSKGINAIFEMLRNILHEGQLDKRVQYMIEVMFQIRKDGFKDHVAIIEELDIIMEEDQFTHLITLEDVKNGEDILNVFKFDGDFEANEDKYKALSKEILNTDNDSDSGSEGSDESSEEDEENVKENVIIDNTETNLIALRRTIYLTIQSSLDYEECAHKLMKMQLKPGQEMELCHMFLDCCAEQRTYEKFYGLLSQRFCQINKIYVGPFEQIFKDTYSTVHRLAINKLRNVSKFFAHLLFTDAISWEVLEVIKLNKDDTTSSSRIFIKIIFQELAEYMGLAKLNERLKDTTLHSAFSGLFPRDDPKNTRFAINFFTSIGLGGLTDELREHMKTSVKMQMERQSKTGSNKSSTSSSVESESSSDSSSSDSSSSSSSESTSSSSSSDEKSKKKSKKSATKSVSKKEKSKNKSKYSDDSKHKQKTSSESKHKQKASSESKHKQKASSESKHTSKKKTKNKKK